MDYEKAKILAPMVRAGSLPLRLLSLEHGADIVYGEEIVDKRLLASERSYNEKLGIVEFKKGGMITFSTCEQEQGKNVFQIGTADAVLALKAATMVAGDVAAIDVNMGCPKRFSVHAGMGAALLSTPERAKDIVATLSRNLPIPVSCKIRLLDGGVQDTIRYMKLMEAAGACAITVHARTRDMRPREPALWEKIKEIVDLKPVAVPIIHNGDIWVHEDFEECFKETGATGAMTARGALQNPSIFSPVEVDPHTIVQQYLKKCVDTETIYQNAKYVIQTMYGTGMQLPHGIVAQRAKSLFTICDAFDIGEYFKEHERDGPHRSAFVGALTKPDKSEREDSTAVEAPEAKEAPTTAVTET